MHGQRKEWRIKRSDAIIGLTKINVVFCFKRNLYWFIILHMPRYRLVEFRVWWTMTETDRRSVWSNWSLMALLNTLKSRKFEYENVW